MLALAPLLNDHSSTHSAAALSNIVSSRSRPAARRAPLSSAQPSSFSSSSSVPSSSTTISSRTNISSAQSATGAPHTPKRTVSSQAVLPTKPPESAGKVAEERTSFMANTATGSKSPTVDIATYPTNDLLRVLAQLLNHIASANDSLPKSTPVHTSVTPRAEHSLLWQSLTTASRTSLSTSASHLIFHARNVPAISLEAYLLRIHRYCPTSNEVFISLLVYFDRMSELAQEATGTRFVIDSYNVHRLIIAGVTAASKFHSDIFYTNTRYAKVGGLSREEMNQLEVQFLLLNDFRLLVSTAELQRYADHLISFSQDKNGASMGANYDQTNSSTLGPPSRPLQSMGEYDNYGSAHYNNSQLVNGAHQTPKRFLPALAADYSYREKTQYENDSSETSTPYETETDAETDDEPTIRPAHSCASSDTQSLFSNDASEASESADDDEDELNDEDDEGSATDEERPPITAHATSRPWPHSRSASIDIDKLMASP